MNTVEKTKGAKSNFVFTKNFSEVVIFNFSFKKDEQFVTEDVKNYITNSYTAEIIQKVEKQVLAKLKNGEIKSYEELNFNFDLSDMEEDLTKSEKILACINWEIGKKTQKNDAFELFEFVETKKVPVLINVKVVTKKVEIKSFDLVVDKKWAVKDVTPDIIQDLKRGKTSGFVDTDRDGVDYAIGWTLKF